MQIFKLGGYSQKMEEKKEESIISEGSAPEDEDCVHDGWVTVTTNNVKVNND